MARANTKTTLLRYAAIALVAKTLMAMLVFIISMSSTGFEVAGVFSDNILLTIISVGIAISIYKRRHALPLVLADAMTFGACFGVGSFILAVINRALEIVQAGQDLSVSGLGVSAFGVGHQFSDGEVLFATLGDLVIGAAMSFGLAVLFAKLLTKNWGPAREK